jgi:hypothetical protein
MIHDFMVLTKGRCDCDLQKHSPTEEEGLGPGIAQSQTQQGQATNLFPPVGLGGRSLQDEDGPTNPSFPPDIGPPQPQITARRYEEFYSTSQTAATPAPDTGNPSALMQDHEEDDSALQPDPKTPWGQHAQAQRQAMKPTVEEDNEAKEALKALVLSVAHRNIKNCQDLEFFKAEWGSVLSQIFDKTPAQRNPPSKLSASPGQSGSSGVYHKGYRGGDYYPDQSTFLPTRSSTESYHPHDHSPDAVKCSICGNLQK